MENQDMNYTEDVDTQPIIFTSKQKILIIGIGNILLQDCGIGVHIIKELQKMNLPDNIELIDGGTHGLDLMDYTNKGVDKVIIINALTGGMVPGSVFRLSPNEIITSTKHISFFHQTELIETFHMIDLFRRKPGEIVIIGIVPKETEWSLTLSSELQNKLPEIIRVVFDEIEKK